MNGFFKFVSGLLTFAFISLIVSGVVAVLLRLAFDRPGPLNHSTVAVIPKGEGVYEIAGRLEREGIIGDRRLFVAHYLSTRMHAGMTGGKLVQLKAGEYEIRKQASLRQVLATLAEGKAILYRISLPEGLTSQQIVERLKADPNLAGDITEMPPEGTLLPDTYKFSRGTSRQELIDRMRTEQQRFVTAVWERRQKDLPYETRDQALTMASIVEKETGRADERERVAAVFVNRLRKGMRLQSDPTIIYGIVAGQGTLGRPITRSDIDTRTPYNTYQINGLPPTPICNPGRSAIQATLNPARTSDLYFVADGSGGHTFSATLKEHNAAVQVWRQLEREARARQNAVVVPAKGAEPDATATGGASEPAPSAQQTEVEPTPPLPVRKPRR